MLADVLLKIAADQLNEEGEHKYYPRPSSSGPERCIRQMVYHGLNRPKPRLSGRAAIVFSDSSWHEELTLDLMRESAYTCHSDQMASEIPNCFPWLKGTRYCRTCDDQVPAASSHGHIDWLVTDLLGNDILVEHKALSHFGYMGLLNGHLPLDYFTQMAIYMRGIQRIQPNLRQGILLVKNKNQSAYLEIDCTYSGKADTLYVNQLMQHTGESEPIGQYIKNITNDAFRKFEIVQKHIVDRTLPPRQYAYDHWRCSYCSYTDDCWANYVEEFQQMHKGAVYKADEDISALVKQERLLQFQEAQAKKKRAGVKKQITDFLTDSNNREIQTDEYEIQWKASETSKLIVDDIPPDVRKKATKKVPSHRLNIKKMKVEK